MRMMSRFWKAATALDPSARERPQGKKFAFCNPAALASSSSASGLANVELRTIDVPTVFRNFDDYWRPMLSGNGSIVDYVLSLPGMGSRPREDVAPSTASGNPAISRHASCTQVIMCSHRRLCRCS
jgi:hypothetical protein